MEDASVRTLAVILALLVAGGVHAQEKNKAGAKK